MTTQVQFTPPTRGTFSFVATLDGNQYTISVPWNVQAQRFFVVCGGPNNTVIFRVALIGSPDCLPIASITSSQSGRATVTTQAAHGFPVGGVLKLLFFGQAPSAYSGMQLCAVTGATTLTFETGSNPGAATVAGFCKQVVDIAGGYFQTSILEYWASAGQFVVIP